MTENNKLYRICHRSIKMLRGLKYIIWGEDEEGVLVQPGEKKINEESDFILQLSERVYGEVVLDFSNKHIVKGQAAVFIS